MNNFDIKLEHVTCNLCGGDDFKFLYKKPDTKMFISDLDFSVVQCRACGLAFVNPRPAQESIKIFYPKEYYDDLCKERLDENQGMYNSEAKYLEDLKPGRVLDIGCAGGGFLKILLDMGWQTSGMDLFNTAKNEYHLDIKYGSLEGIHYESESFDLVTAWAVFEHLQDPKGHFKEISRILKKGGRLIFTATNINSLMSRWGYAEDIPRHLYFFSEKTINRYAEECGFFVDSIIFSNDIYAGYYRDIFRVRFLRWLGVPWKNVYERQKNPLLRLAGILGSILGILLIWPSLEAKLKHSGVMVVTLIKS